VHAAQKGPVVDTTPRQHALEAFSQGQLADAKSRLVMADSVIGPVVEGEVA